MQSECTVLSKICGIGFKNCLDSSVSTVVMVCCG